MNYYSSTTTKPTKNGQEDVKFESNETHHIIRVAWDHYYRGTTDIKVTTPSLEIKASSFDGLNHYSLELKLSLNYDILSLDGAFYNGDDKAFRIHIPKKNMKLQKKETVSLPEQN
jgi:hypothetical protein